MENDGDSPYSPTSCVSPIDVNCQEIIEYGSDKERHHLDASEDERGGFRHWKEHPIPSEITSSTNCKESVIPKDLTNRDNLKFSLDVELDFEYEPLETGDTLNGGCSEQVPDVQPRVSDSTHAAEKDATCNSTKECNSIPEGFLSEDGEIISDSSEHSDKPSKTHVEKNYVTSPPHAEKEENVITPPRLEELPRKVCPYFSYGRCTWGNNCKFLHTNDGRGTYHWQSQPGELFASQRYYTDRDSRNNFSPRRFDSSQFSGSPDASSESDWEKNLMQTQELILKAKRKKKTSQREKRSSKHCRPSSESDRPSYHTRPSPYARLGSQSPDDEDHCAYSSEAEERTRKKRRTLKIEEETDDEYKRERERKEPVRVSGRPSKLYKPLKKFYVTNQHRNSSLLKEQSPYTRKTYRTRSKSRCYSPRGRFKRRSESSHSSDSHSKWSKRSTKRKHMYDREISPPARVVISRTSAFKRKEHPRRSWSRNSASSESSSSRSRRLSRSQMHYSRNKSRSALCDENHHDSRFSREQGGARYTDWKETCEYKSHQNMRRHIKCKKSSSDRQIRESATKRTVQIASSPRARTTDVLDNKYRDSYRNSITPKFHRIWSTQRTLNSPRSCTRDPFHKVDQASVSPQKFRPSLLSPRTRRSRSWSRSPSPSGSVSNQSSSRSESNFSRCRSRSSSDSKSPSDSQIHSASRRSSDMSLSSSSWSRSPSPSGSASNQSSSRSESNFSRCRSRSSSDSKSPSDSQIHSASRRSSDMSLSSSSSS